MNTFLNHPWGPLIITAFIGAIIVGGLLHILSFNKKRKSRGKMQILRDLFSFILFSAFGITLIYTAPVSDAIKDHTIQVIGLFLTVLAFGGSFNATKNFFSGIILRLTTPFVPKDILQFKDGKLEGWVVNIGTTTTLLQNEYGDIISIPNSIISNSEYTKINYKGTFLAHRIGLGYDLNKSEVKKALKKAAENCGLDKIAVLIHETLDHVISYEVRGYLSNVENYFAERAHLKEEVVDSIHSLGMEITSPQHMVVRHSKADEKFMHTPSMKDEDGKSSINEQIKEASGEASKKKEDYHVNRNWEKLEADILSIEKQIKEVGSKDKIKKEISKHKQDRKTLEETQCNPECHTMSKEDFDKKINEYNEKIEALKVKLKLIGELELAKEKAERSINNIKEYKNDEDLKE